ncbi:MAG: DUF1778 domain-containing protein [Acetobacteraceae bacterium]|nr:DUF1778 domain-containing protein [Acetobacteraceae bacterium]
MSLAFAPAVTAPEGGRIEFRLPAVPEARAVIENAERLALSERDSLRVLALLENPPPPTEKLRRAAKAARRIT